MIDELNIFHEFIAVINQARNVEELPDNLIRKITFLFNADSGSIFLLDEDKKMIRTLSATGDKSDKLFRISLKPGTGICGKVIESGQSICVNNPTKSDDFNKTVDKQTGFQTKNIICAPIILRGKVIGALEVLNKKESDFTSEDVQMLELIARYLSYPLENTLLLDRLTEEIARKESLIENMPGGLLVISIDEFITAFNRKAAQVLGIAQYSVKGRNYKEALKSLPDFVSMIENYMRLKQIAFRKEIILTIAGQLKKIGYSIFLIRRKDDKIIAIGISFQDLTNIPGEGGKA